VDYFTPYTAKKYETTKRGYSRISYLLMLFRAFSNLAAGLFGQALNSLILGVHRV
jgi:hypothetical protein